MEGIACAPCFEQAGAPNRLPEKIDALPCGYDSGAGPASEMTRMSPRGGVNRRFKLFRYFFGLGLINAEIKLRV